ncbi:tetratricopeptide repeat-containing sensor histidine kinase [Spirosoma panaciterrae]|uniref:tetratricopeptide repeat-containing sensor histidine kinase n=1 Tax=Spirosoma panaciterrae TaxID=496058 RepID=UPI0012FC6EF9|nr:tetratricopeptide repeat-containing sensor histidine kinase [Spirosoma panaciterrae]
MKLIARSLLIALFTWTVCGYCTEILAQTGELAALQKKLSASQPDTNRVKLLNKIGDEYAYNDIKTARRYYHDGHVLSQQLGFVRGIIRYYSSEGELLNLEGKYDQCMTLLRQGVALSRARKDPMREGIMYENMGNTFGLMQRLDSATVYYFKSLPIFESFQDSVKLANVYNNLSSVFMQTDKPETALTYIDQAIAISRASEDGFYLSHLVNKEAILWKLRRRTEANQTNQQIITLARKLNDTVALADALQNECQHDLETGHFQTILAHAQALNQLSPGLQSPDRTAWGHYWLSVGYYYQNQFTPALFHIEKALSESRGLGNSQHLQAYYSQYARLLLAAKNDLQQAAHYEQLADSLRDVRLNNTIVKTTRELATKYETEKKETAIQQLSLENQNRKRLVSLLVFSVIVLAGALLFFGLWMRNRARVQQQEKALYEQTLRQLENEKQLLASHALVKGQEDERSRLAKDLHDGLGGILSSVKYSFQAMKQTFVLSEENALAFEKSMNLLDASLAELRRVSHNMMPEALVRLSLEEALRDYIQTLTDNTDLNFTYQTFGLDTVDLDNLYKTTIYRVVQELTTNIVRHAQATEVLIQIMAKAGQINLTIEDNGKGFDPKQVNKSRSMGIQNLYHRITYLKGTIDLQTEPGKGCSYYIEIPLNHD